MTESTTQRENESYDFGVVGLGISGLAALRFLVTRNFRCFAADTRAIPPGLPEARTLLDGSDIRLGPLAGARLADAPVLIVAPGLDLRESPFPELAASGIELVGDVELFARIINAPCLAVTGSNGKSTVTTLLDTLVGSAGLEVATGGNLGVPALDLWREPAPHAYVLELSSFQLESLQTLRPMVATVLNVTADHMDRYDSLESYAAAKRRIYRGARQVVAAVDADPLVLDESELDAGTVVHRYGGDDPSAVAYAVADGQLLADGVPVLPLDALPLKGRHNHENMLAALTMGRAFGLTDATMLPALRSFRGLKHRCELVASRGGVQYIDDSKGTNVAATLAAIDGLALGRNLVLIAGGQGKGADFAPLIDACKRHVKHALLLGEAASELAALLGDATECTRHATMEDAVSAAAVLAAPGDLVLLSPACASFDMFKGYAHRGQVFADAVLALGSDGEGY